jgi:hypothetical protein
MASLRRCASRAFSTPIKVVILRTALIGCRKHGVRSLRMCLNEGRNELNRIPIFNVGGSVDSRCPLASR